MGKLKVIIRDSNTLVLQEDGQKGDYIDLRDLSVDHTDILDAIKKAKDQEYEKLLANEKTKFEIEKKNALLETKSLFEDEVSKIQIKLSDKENELKLLSEKLSSEKDKALREAEKVAIDKLREKESELNNVIENLKQQITILKETQESKLKFEMQQIENKYQKSINEKESELKVLAEKLSGLETNLKLVYQNEKLELKQSLEKQINEKSSEIQKLNLEMKTLDSNYKNQLSHKIKEIEDIRREKSEMNIKQIGEDLENWCNQQWKTASPYGFKTSSFEKDNTVVKVLGEKKGTKGDYIFKVYNNNLDDKILLTSAMCEMKTEELESENKKKNADHYDKLDKDRKKKNLEYAILVSELEYKKESDAPIFVVSSYEKMYVVRPAYFMILLGIIESIGLKYAELITQKKREELEFKDSEEILNSFEAFKENILNNAFKHINTQLGEIEKNATNISKEANKILELISLVVNTHMNTIRNKIESYSIVNLNAKIDKYS